LRIVPPGGIEIEGKKKYGSRGQLKCDATRAETRYLLSEKRTNPFNPLSPELNPICYLLALLAHDFLHVSRIKVKSLTLR
jgi:transposase